MLSPRWRKVLRDLWHNKTRTILVVLSIAVGVFAVGMIVSTQIMLAEDLSASYISSNPSSAQLYPTSFDEELVQVVRRMEGIREAEGRASASVRLKVGPEQWVTLQLEAIHDFDDMRLHQIVSAGGSWPPAKRELLIERASLGLTRAQLGDTVTVEAPDGKQRQIRIVGLAHDMFKPPAAFVGTPYGYVNFETLEWLGFSPTFNQLSILVSEHGDDKDHIQAVADRVQDKIEKSGRTVYWIYIPNPGEHPAWESVSPLLMILGVLGTLSLFLSGFLVINTISALMAQQVRQIGIMKAIGARAPQIVQMYMTAVLIFGLLSLALAVPLGGAAAYGITAYMAGLINFDLAGFRIPTQALVLEVAVGLLVPFLTALYPVIAGVRITVREAISTYGLGKGQFGTGVVDRLLGRVRGLSRPLLLSLRNTFRRKARLALTLSTLTLGGAIFIGVLTVHTSLLATLDDALSYWAYDVEVNFSRTHRIVEIEQEAMRVPGVVQAESWTGNTARRIRPDGHEGPNLYVLAPPADTSLIQPTVIEGRWLVPEDENAAVVNTYILKEEPDIKLGDRIVLKIEGRETTWNVVGIVKGTMTGPIVYANQPYFARVIHFVGRSGGVQIVGQQHDAAYQSQLEKRLKEHFDSRGLRVSSTQSISSLRANVEYQFGIIVIFLTIMAVLIAVVGGLGLMGTMSINVLERTREIGVMRAVGASDGSVLKIVIVEGLFIGLLSWCVGGLLSLPISQLLCNVVGVAFLQVPLSYVFSTNGALLWLGIVLVLSALASLLPARSASRLTVREVLAYE
jgi:putative ABC transport system permease protein